MMLTLARNLTLILTMTLHLFMTLTLTLTKAIPILYLTRTRTRTPSLFLTLVVSLYPILTCVRGGYLARGDRCDCPPYVGYVDLALILQDLLPLPHLLLVR